MPFVIATLLLCMSIELMLKLKETVSLKVVLKGRLIFMAILYMKSRVGYGVYGVCHVVAVIKDKRRGFDSSTPHK